MSLVQRLAEVQSTYKALQEVVNVWTVSSNGRDETHSKFCYWLNHFNCVYDDWLEEYEKFRTEMVQYLEECGLS